MSCWTKARDRDDCCSSFRSHAFSGQFLLRAFILRQMGKPHSAQHGGGFGELNVLVTNDLDAVAPWIEEIKKRPGKDCYARLGKGRADGFPIVDNEPKCRPSSGP